MTASGNVEDMESIRRFAVTYLRNERDIDLQAFGVRFDRYYLESSLYSDGRVDRGAVAGGQGQDLSEGALWLRTTVDGDEDRVMKKSDGTYTYFVPTWPTTHQVGAWLHQGHQRAGQRPPHGTIARVRARPAGLDISIPKGYPDYVLHKMVTVMKDGREVKISKRAGSYVTVRDLIEWSNGGDETIRGLPGRRRGGGRPTSRAGRDAVLLPAVAQGRYRVRLRHRRGKQNDENPVYYVQYAHARICSIFESWAGADWEAQSKLARLSDDETGRRDRRRRAVRRRSRWAGAWPSSPTCWPPPP